MQPRSQPWYRDAGKQVLTTVKNANLALMFLLELAVYVAAAIWGATVSQVPAVRLAAGIGAPVALAAIWGVFGSPRARFPARGAARVALELAWFGAGAAALGAAGHVAAAIVFGALYLTNAALRRLWHQ